MSQPSQSIVTERLLLRPFTTDDVDAVLAWEGLDVVHRYLYTSPRTREEVRRVIEQRLGMTAIDDERDTIRLAVVVRDGATVVGDVGLHRTSREHRQGEIGFMFHPDHHGRGYATEAVRPLLGVGFDGARLHRIVGRCDARNGASARVMERLGMRREAHLVENEFVKGEWTDELVYAMLAREWSELRAGSAQEVAR
jgi:RimJ/RimL family protein N-acetyltransferase